jgi:hypothetical protein
MCAQNTRCVKNTTKINRDKILADNLKNIVHPGVLKNKIDGKDEIKYNIANYLDWYPTEFTLDVGYKSLYELVTVNFNITQKKYAENIFKLVANGAFLFFDFTDNELSMQFFESAMQEFNVNQLYNVSLFYSVRDIAQILNTDHFTAEELKPVRRLLFRYVNMFSSLKARNERFFDYYPDYLKYVIVPFVPDERYHVHGIPMIISSCVTQHEFIKQYPYYAFYYQYIEAYKVYARKNKITTNI